jgi:hypothetical protein
LGLVHKYGFTELEHNVSEYLKFARLIAFLFFLERRLKVGGQINNTWHT